MSLNDENVKIEEKEAPKKAPTAKKTSSFNAGFVEQIELIVIAFAAIVLIFSFLFRTCQVSGPSMENTLLDKETVIVSNLFYKPDRNDIIVFHQTGTLNEPVVKRVIGIPGDTVTVSHMTDKMIVTITDESGNTSILEEPYVKYDGYRPWMNDCTVYVEEDTVFVMGDNRSNSNDSRGSDIGLVDTRRILGKVILRVSPFSRFGTVK